MQEPPLLDTIAIVLVISWLPGLVATTLQGGLIHVLFIVTVPMILLAHVNGRGSRGST